MPKDKKARPGQNASAMPDEFVAEAERREEYMRLVARSMTIDQHVLARRIVITPVGGQWMLDIDEPTVRTTYENFRQSIVDLVRDHNRHSGRQGRSAQDLRLMKSMNLYTCLTIRNRRLRFALLATVLFGDIYGDLTSGTLWMLNFSRMAATKDPRGVFHFADWNGIVPFSMPASDETVAPPDNEGFAQFTAVVACMLSPMMLPKLEYRIHLGPRWVSRGLYLFGRAPSRIGSNLCCMDTSLMSAEMQALLGNCQTNCGWATQDADEVTDLWYRNMPSDEVWEIYQIMHPFIALRTISSVVMYLRHNVAHMGIDAEMRATEVFLDWVRPNLNFINTFFFNVPKWMDMHREVFFHQGTRDEQNREVVRLIEVARRACLLWVYDKFFKDEGERPVARYQTGARLVANTPFGFADWDAER